MISTQSELLPGKAPSDASAMPETSSSQQRDDIGDEMEIDGVGDTFVRDKTSGSFCFNKIMLSEIGNFVFQINVVCKEGDLPEAFAQLSTRTYKVTFACLCLPVLLLPVCVSLIASGCLFACVWLPICACDYQSTAAYSNLPARLLVSFSSGCRYPFSPLSAARYSQLIYCCHSHDHSGGDGSRPTK